MHFNAVEKLRKCSGLVIYSCFKDSSFTAVKGMQSSKLGMLKGTIISSIEGMRKGICSVKNGYKGKEVGPWGQSSRLRFDDRMDKTLGLKIT